MATVCLRLIWFTEDDVPVLKVKVVLLSLPPLALVCELEDAGEAPACTNVASEFGGNLFISSTLSGINVGPSLGFVAGRKIPGIWTDLSLLVSVPVEVRKKRFVLGLQFYIYIRFHVGFILVYFLHIIANRNLKRMVKKEECKLLFGEEHIVYRKLQP